MSTPELQIQGTPVLVNALYVPIIGTPPPSAHLLGYGSGTFLEALLSLPPQVQTLLGTPLDQLFQNDWSSLQGTAQNQARQAIQSASSSIYNVSPVSTPQQGTLQAYTTPVNSFWRNWGHNGTVLSLIYSLPGWSVSFKYSTGSIAPDPAYNVSFDGAISVDIGVPADTSVPLYIAAEFDATNFQISAGNVWAVVYDLVYAIASSIGISLFNLPNLPNSESAPIQVPAAFANLSTAFVKAADFGFTQLGVAVITNPPPGPPAGNTVEFDLTHPADPGPQVSNALVSSVPSFSSPEIFLSANAVHPGDTVLVQGLNFPAAQANQLQIKWTNTTSGLLDHSEVQWGATSAQGVPPAQITDETTQGNTFTATGLTPGTWYGFLVREFDTQGFVATGWSVPAVPPLPDPQPWNGIWTYLQTQDTDQVGLVLNDNQGNFVANVGTGTMNIDGSFSATTLPLNFQPGPYELIAAVDGQPMAPPAPITIIADGQALPTQLQVVDPTTKKPYQGTVNIVAGSPVYLSGQNFPAGIVNLWADAIGVGGISLGTVFANFSGNFTAQPITWPLGVTGGHNIVADPGSPPPVPVYAQFPAQ